MVRRILREVVGVKGSFRDEKGKCVGIGATKPWNALLSHTHVKDVSATAACRDITILAVSSPCVASTAGGAFPQLLLVGFTIAVKVLQDPVGLRCCAVVKANRCLPA